MTASPPAEEAARLHVRGALERMSTALESLPAVLRRVIEQETAVDLDDLAEQARRVLHQ